MAVRGRNLGADVGLAEVIGMGNVSLGSSSGRLTLAKRSSVQLGEFSALVAQTQSGGETTGAYTFDLKMYVDKVATTLLSGPMPDNSAYKVELTTRDGTLAWASAYQNAADRVFPIGTLFTVETGGEAAAADMIAFYLQIREYGAPPA